MRYVMVAIKDHKTNAFTPPSAFRHTGQAIRAFIDNINNPRGDAETALMNRYRNDYDLYHIGNFDDETGTFEQIQPALLYNGDAVTKGE